jgi:hypothetical protein
MKGSAAVFTVRLSILSCPASRNTNPEEEMENSIWFVTDGVSALACFETREEALEYKEQFSDDDDYFNYELYDINVDDLEDYPDEYDLAIEEGLI